MTDNHRQASDEQSKRLLPLSVTTQSVELQERLEKAKAALVPATPKQVVAELAACLTLVAPSGMSADDRSEWLRVARMTIGEVAGSALSEACNTARLKCRRVSDLVPMIAEIAAEEEKRLRASAATAQYLFDNPPAPRVVVEIEETPFTVEEIVNMPRDIRLMGERNDLFDRRTLAEAKAIIAQRAE